MATSSKNHLKKLTDKSGVKAENFHQQIFGGTPEAEPAKGEGPPKSVNSPNAPKEKMVQRSFMLPADLLLAFQTYRIKEMDENVDSKALVRVLKEFLAAKGYWEQD